MPRVNAAVCTSCELAARLVLLSVVATIGSRQLVFQLDGDYFNRQPINHLNTRAN